MPDPIVVTTNETHLLVHAEDPQGDDLTVTECIVTLVNGSAPSSQPTWFDWTWRWNAYPRLELDVTMNLLDAWAAGVRTFSFQASVKDAQNAAVPRVWNITLTSNEAPTMDATEDSDITVEISSEPAPGSPTLDKGETSTIHLRVSPTP